MISVLFAIGSHNHKGFTFTTFPLQKMIYSMKGMFCVCWTDNERLADLIGLKRSLSSGSNHKMNIHLSMYAQLYTVVLGIEARASDITMDNGGTLK